MKKQRHKKFCILHSAFSRRLCVSARNGFFHIQDDSPRRRPSADERAGFTLIELVVVMLVIGILTVLAIEKFTGAPSWSAPLAADELGVHLRYIRNLALTRERTTRVIFSVVSNSYTVAVDTNGAGGWAMVKDPVTQTDWVVDIAGKFSGVTLASVNIGGGSTLYFSGASNGIPCGAGITPLTANGTIVFNSGQTVTIVPDTGYIELE